MHAPTFDYGSSMEPGKLNKDDMVTNVHKVAATARYSGVAPYCH